MLDDFGQRIRDIILSEMDLSRELSDEEICDLIGSVVSREARDRPMTIKDRAELERTIFNSLRKLDVLQELVDDRDVTEIMVNGPNDIFYEKAGRIQRFKGHFSSEEKLEDVIQQIVGRHNRVVNQASGIDIIVQLGRLRDKSRRVLEISEVDGFMDDEIVLHTLYRFEETAVLDSGRIQGFLKKEGTLCHTDKLMAAGLSV